MKSNLLQSLDKEQLKKRNCVFIRHGDTEMNDKDLARGWTETQLDEKGERDAEKLGGKLKDLKIDCLISSDLLRTLQTTLAVSRESGIPIVALCSNLHTWNIGKYTGQSAKKVDPILEKIAIMEPDKEIEGGESFDMFKHRFILQVISFLNEHVDKTIAFVVHGRNLAIINAWKEAGYPDDLELDYENLGYDIFPPATAHLFSIESKLLV